MELDFMLQLNREINTFDLFAESSIGFLCRDESISIMAMPGGAETKFMDGSKDKDYQVQVYAKSMNRSKCFKALTTIYQRLETLGELPSSNDSYDFNKIETKSLPSLVVEDERGYLVYALSISVKITIYRGVLEK